MKDKIDRLLLNYSNARQSWESWLFMNDSGPMNFTTGRPDYELSEKKKVDENILLKHLRYLAWKDYNIEICKIIKYKGNSTKDSVFLLLKEFLTIRPDLKQQIDANLLELGTLKIDIDKIVALRDKFYAHLDPDYLNLQGQVGLEGYHNIFIAVENSIMTLTSRTEFQLTLDKIPSRNEFWLPYKEN